MAVAPAYVSADSLKSSLSMQNFSFADADILEAVTTASRAVDLACDRKFYTGDLSETRYYTPIRPLVLEIDDLVNFESLTVDQDGDGVFESPWTLHTDFELEPLNAAPDGRPWERAVANQRVGNRFPYGVPRSVEIVGTFGWLQPPDGVVTLTRLLATQILLRVRQAPFGIAGFDVNGAMRIAREDPAMRMLLRDLDRSSLFL